MEANEKEQVALSPYNLDIVDEMRRQIVGELVKFINSEQWDMQPIDAIQEHMGKIVSKTVKKFFDYAADTDKKLAIAYSEINRLRHEAHNVTLISYRQVLALAQHSLRIPRGETVSHTELERQKEFFKSVENLINLSQAVSEQVNEGEKDEPQQQGA